MVKNIIILSVIYISFTLVVATNMDKIGDSSFMILLVLNVSFALLLFLLIYKKYFIGFKPKNNKINYTNSEGFNTSSLKKISKKPFFFGLEKQFISEEDLYFDNDKLYVVNKESQRAVFNLTDIVELSKTSIQINNRRLWKIIIQQGNEDETIFKFAHNYTLWNKSFYHFYERVKQINPSAIKSKWNVWSM